MPSEAASQNNEVKFAVWVKTGRDLLICEAAFATREPGFMVSENRFALQIRLAAAAFYCEIAFVK
ncbi:hypothetical protein [Paenibacillus sp. NPDC058174]|uniref:hypothetical protein n=1 Tax=Paenibacillus sp. NPDC058174 TaxID=3346366 RepID=UPI0036DF223B